MEPHAPAGPIRSLKDFFLHLGIVTVGILIALGLEQLVEISHHANLAKLAVQGFRREITDDVGQVKEILDAMPKTRAQVQAAIKNLSDASAAGAAPAPIEYPDINFDFISTASWDTALATQALNDLPYDNVKRYAGAYGVLRLFLDQERSSINQWQDMRRFGVEPAALTKDERVALIEELRRYESYTYAIELIGKGALQACADALK